MSRAVNISEVEKRFGSWGPGYLVQADDAAFGVVTLRPGDEFANHYHEQHTESFYVVQGAAEVWLDQSECVSVQPGDFIQCRPNVQHYLRNVGDEEFTAVFTKSPGVCDDKIAVDWRPGEHTP